MVGFGSSLRMAKRTGWERAYLDYEALKLLLSQIEAVYEEEGHRRQEDNATPKSNNKRKKSTDYRDELFLESDSDLAFASSLSDVLGDDSSDDEEVDEGLTQPGPTTLLQNPIHANPFAYSQPDASSSDGWDDEDYGGAMSECAGGTLTRAWRRGDHKNAVLAKSKKKNKRGDATEFFVGDFLLQDEKQSDEETDSAQQSYSSSLLSKSFQRGSFTTEQTALLHQSHSSSTSQTASFYAFPTSKDTSLTPPRDYYYSGQVGTLGTHVKTLSNSPVALPPSNTKETRAEKLAKERRKKQRQRRRKRLAQRKRLLEQRVPHHLRVAHGKARAITERFLGLLRAEVEKVTLFAQSRLGELADTAGSLRFPANDDSEYGGSFSGSFSRPVPYEILSDGGRHPSSSSSEDEGQHGGLFPWADSSDDEEKTDGAIYVRQLRKSSSAGGVSVSTEHRANISAHGNAGGTKDERNRAEPSQANIKQQKSLDAAQRQIAHFEELRQNKPLFQRIDDILGEDLILLSAVDETDGYTAVAVELMHVLRFICVNVIAVRKICRKHDRLLANRMLGGYYHRKQRESAVESSEQTLGNTLLSSDSLKREALRGRRNKLEGVFDSHIQQLADSTTVQVISSCLALALSEYEVSRSRADALARLNSSSNMDETPLRSGKEGDDKNDRKRGAPFGLSPIWMAKKTEDNAETEVHLVGSHDGDDAPSTASGVSLTRLRFTVVSVFALREAARSSEDNFASYLSRISLVVPGSIGEGLDGCSRETLEFFVQYNPDVALLVDPSSLYRGLGDAGRRGSTFLRVLATGRAASRNESLDSASEEMDTDRVMNALAITPAAALDRSSHSLDRSSKRITLQLNRSMFFR